ncbi:MAG: M20/M25/M40 family metallo-hydrolase [Planctomycetota bacterium]
MPNLTRPLARALALTAPALLLACASNPAPQTNSGDAQSGTPTTGVANEAATPPATAATADLGLELGFEFSSAILDMYERHITTLADPVVMTGRLPGTEGIETAASYIEDHFASLDLEPAFPKIRESEGSFVIVDSDRSYRQPFDVGGGAKLEIDRFYARSPSGARSVFTPEEQYNVVGYGVSGLAEGPIAFIGYSIDNGADGYDSFVTPDGELDDLTGHVALLLRFEPHDDTGASKFAQAGWSAAAALQPKFLNAVQRGAEGVIMVTPASVDDPRGKALESIATTSRGRPLADLPVLHATPDAANLLFEATGAGVTIEDLIASANDLEAQSARVFDRGSVSIDVEIDRSPISTDNVGAILRGSSGLENEYVVIGGHYDHVGNGPYGTRRPGELHPGADDNASGTSGVLTAATLLADMYDRLPDDMPRRSVLFLLFSAEEAGLIGSRYYAQNAIAPADKHHVMINLDMIGSYGDGQGIELGALDSGDRLREVFAEAFETSGLDFVPDSGIGTGRSDHANFDSIGVPNVFLFSGLTDQYHTPDDTLDTIDIDGAARVATLAAHMALSAALDPGDILHADDKPARQAIGGPLSIRVRVGIAPATYAGEDGVVIGTVYDDTSADLGGLKEGDRIIKWGDEDVTTVQSWTPMLAGHQPGDEVDVVVVRDGQEIKLTLELQARNEGG